MRSAPTEKVKSFQKVFQTGLKSHGRFHSSHLLVDLGGDDEQDTRMLVRAAVVASKKAVGKRAVKRNRAKRRLRPLMSAVVCEFRQNGSLPSGPVNWVVRAKAACLDCSSEELRLDLHSALTSLLSSASRRSKKKDPEEKTLQNQAAHAIKKVASEEQA